MDATEALELQKEGIIPVDADAWIELFDTRTDQERGLDRLADEYLEWIDEWQRDMRETQDDARLDYGGI